MKMKMSLKILIIFINIYINIWLFSVFYVLYVSALRAVKEHVKDM